MAIVTFLSDFGIKDHYVAAVKARILSINPGLQIIDISHEVIPGDMGQASFILKNVYKSFPPGTVHLVAVDDPTGQRSEYIAVKTENLYFVGADNGLFGLVTQNENYVVSNIGQNKNPGSFPALEILAPTAAHLASGKDISDVGMRQPTFRKMLNRLLRANKEQIIGHVIHIDNYGNLITNIDRETFEKLTVGKHFYISFGRENTRKIHEGYFSVEPGDCFVIFNHYGLWR